MFERKTVKIFTFQVYYKQKSPLSADIVDIRNNGDIIYKYIKTRNKEVLRRQTKGVLH